MRLTPLKLVNPLHSITNSLKCTLVSNPDLVQAGSEVGCLLLFCTRRSHRGWRHSDAVGDCRGGPKGVGGGRAECKSERVRLYSQPNGNERRVCLTSRPKIPSFFYVTLSRSPTHAHKGPGHTVNRFRPSWAMNGLFQSPISPSLTPWFEMGKYPRNFN